MGEEKRVLQIGGLAGLLAGVLFLLTIPIFLVLLPPAPGGDPDGFLGTVFPENRATFTVIGILALLAYLLSVPLLLALHRSLKETSPTYAMGGLLFYILYFGFIVIAPGELVAHLFVTPQLAELYPAAGTDAGRAAVVQTFRALDLISDQMFFAAFLFFSLSALFLGAVMWRNRDYGRTYGGVTLLLGIAVIVTLPTIVVTSGIRFPFLPLVLWFVFGWKLYALSRAV